MGVRTPLPLLSLRPVSDGNVTVISERGELLTAHHVEYPKVIAVLVGDEGEQTVRDWQDVEWARVGSRRRDQFELARLEAPGGVVDGSAYLGLLTDGELTSSIVSATRAHSTWGVRTSMIVSMAFI